MSETLNYDYWREICKPTGNILHSVQTTEFKCENYLLYHNLLQIVQQVICAFEFRHLYIFRNVFNSFKNFILFGIKFFLSESFEVAVSYL